MPSIPQYTQTVIRKGRFADTVDLSAIDRAGQPFRALSEGADFAAGIIEKKRQDDNAVKLNKAVLDFKKEHMQFSQDLKKQNQLTPQGFSALYEDEYKKFKDNFVQSRMQGYDQDVLDAFESTSQDVNLSGFNSALDFQNRQGAVVAQDSINDGMQSIADRAYAGEDIKNLLGDIDANVLTADIAGMLGDQIAFDNYREGGRTLVVGNSIAGLISRNQLGLARSVVEENKSLIGDVAAGDLMSKIDSAAKKKKEEFDDFDFLQQAADPNSGVFVDPSNKKHMKAVNNAFRFIELEDGRGLTEAFGQMDIAASQIAMEAVKKYGVVPADLRSVTMGMINSGDDQQRAYAYGFINDAEEVTESAFTDKQAQDAVRYQSFIDVGYSSQRALEAVDQPNDPAFQALRTHRVDLWKENKYDEKDFDALAAKAFDKGVLKKKPNAIIAGDDFQKIAREEYLRTGDWDHSLSFAERMLTQKLYGVSGVASSDGFFGGGDVMKYPPENYGNPEMTPDENVKWMRDHLQDVVRPFIDLPSEFEGLREDVNADPDNFTLLPTEASDDLVSLNEKPQYYVFHKDGSDYIRDESNKPLIINFDYKSDPSLLDPVLKSPERLRRQRGEVKDLVLRQHVFGNPDVSALDKALAKAKNKTEDALRGVQNFIDGD